MHCVQCEREGIPRPHFERGDWMCVMSCVTDLHAICLWHMASMVMRSRTLDEVKCPSCRSGLCRLGGRPAQYLLLPQCPPAGPMVGSEPGAMPAHCVPSEPVVSEKGSCVQLPPPGDSAFEVLLLGAVFMDS